MRRSESNPDPLPLTEEELSRLLADMDIDQWLETLRHSDRSLYNLMALEVWSIAKTMDGLIPGFWNRFMENRQISLKQFIQQQQKAANRDPQGPAAGDSVSE
jgi:hypothetical protein